MLTTIEALTMAAIRRTVQEQALAECSSLYLFGAGQHTWWMIDVLPEVMRLPIRGVIDERQHGFCGPWPIITPDRVEAGPDRQGPVIVLSTDCFQDAFLQAARRAGLLEPRCRFVDLYAGLPKGPYFKRSITSPKPGNVQLPRTTERWQRRTANRLAEALTKAAGNGTSALLLGQPWQTAVVGQELRKAGIDATTDHLRAAETTYAVVCDDGMDPVIPDQRRPLPAGITGQRISLCRGERPWVDRSHRTWQTESDEPLRIVIKHEHSLGDVILSQGLLPERLKTEYYPKSHITFITASSNAQRPGSDSTGWCVDLCKHNPFIDRVLASEQTPPAVLMEADLVYTIVHSGHVYEDVCDHHAMLAELPPGRTDATVHLCDDDRRLALEVVAGARRAAKGGPVVGINMSLIQDRFRGWGKEKTIELCHRLRDRLGYGLVWFGWMDFAGMQRLEHPGRPGQKLTVREQAAVMWACDVHITTQGGGANMSAGVGCPTLSITGLHPCWRESAAYFYNHVIGNPAYHHVEIHRRGSELITNGLTGTRRLPWRLTEGRANFTETSAFCDKYMESLWQTEVPASELDRSEPWWWPTRDVTIEDVTSTLVAMIERGAAGRPRSLEAAVHRSGEGQTSSQTQWFTNNRPAARSVAVV